MLVHPTRDLLASLGLHGMAKAFQDLEAQPEVNDMFADICAFLERWLPCFQSHNRSYITVAIGCTGGRHRSVYLCEKLKQHFAACGYNAQVRHKELA